MGHILKSLTHFMQTTEQPRRNRRYWASRLDQNNLDLLVTEVRAGSLRQGWGGPSQSLEAILDKKRRGGDWWNPLPDDQKAAYRNYPFHTGWGEDTIHENDIVLIPNCPTWGYFSLGRAKDDNYQFDPIHASGNDINDADYGHLRAIELLTPEGIATEHLDVHSNIRSTLRCRSRIWRIDHLSTDVEKLLDLVANGDFDPSQKTDADGRFAIIQRSARDKAVAAARNAAKVEFEKLLDANFRAHDMEVVVERILETLYPGASIEHHGGPAEADHGTDTLVRIPNPLSDQDSLIPVQTKKHEGETADGVEQLRKAAGYWSKVGQVIGLALITTADRQTEEAAGKLNALQLETRLPCTFVGRERLVALFVDSLMQTGLR